MSSPAELLSDLMTRFQPSAAEGITCTYQLRLTGNGGDVWHLKVADKQCQLAPGPADKPDVAITINADDWCDLIGGRLDPFSALLSGQLNIEGDFSLATRLQDLFGM